MIKGKRTGRSLQEIGKRWYGFDFELEKVIYCYICCKRIKKKKIRKLDKELKFVSYHQWKQYVWNRYENFDKNTLIEFGRYLNQQIRNIKPIGEYLNIIATAVLTLILTKIVDIFLGVKIDFSGISVWGVFIIFSFIELIIILLSLFLFIEMIYPILDNNTNENLLKDYKEIIDEIISEKENDEKR